MIQGGLIVVGGLLLFIALRGKSDLLLGVLFNPTHEAVPLPGSAPPNTFKPVLPNPFAPQTPGAP